MQRTAALEHLTAIHALAVRLDALGADRELIAACLGIVPEAVAPLLEVATAKLARAQQELGAGIASEGAQDIDELAPDSPMPEWSTSGHARARTPPAQEEGGARHSCP